MQAKFQKYFGFKNSLRIGTAIYKKKVLYSDAFHLLKR